MSVKQENGGLIHTCAIKQETREDTNAEANTTSRNTTRPTFASPTISDVSMIQWPNGRNGSRGSLVKGGDSPWPLYINDMAGRSISGNLASNRAKFANSRRNTMPLLSPDSTNNFALVHQSDSTFSLDHDLVGPSPTPNFSSPRHSAIFGGRKRPFSISPCSAGSLDLNALIRTSPSSLVAYVNNSRGSSAGSIGHLSPSLLVSNPITLQRIQSRLSRPASKQRQNATDNDTSTAVVKTESHNTNNVMDTDCDLNSLSERIVKSQLEAVAEETCSSENEEMITDHGTSESAVTESETERRDKPPRMKAKREYFSYPVHEEPHNNHCLWENCDEKFNSLDELVAHINSIHIYQESKKSFVCRWQGCIRACKEFKAQYMLLVHMRRHTGEKPHKCNFEGCEKAYSRLENLKTHLRSHTGERPYVCKFACGKAFSNASDCAKHENRTHSNARPYVCKNNGCSKCYTDPSSLRKHMKTCTVSKKPKQEDTTGTEEESSNELNASTKASMSKKTGKGRQKKRAAPAVLNSHDYGYVSSDGGGVVYGFPEWSHPQSSGYDTEYNSWKSDQLPASVVALQNNMLSPVSPQQAGNAPFMPPAAPPTQQYTTVNQPVIAPPPVYAVEQHPDPVDVKGNPPHYIIQSQPVALQEPANHSMAYKSHTFPTLPSLPSNRNTGMSHHYSSVQRATNMDSFNHRKLSETSSGISSMSSRQQSLKAVPVKPGFKYRKDSADSSFSTDRSSNASSFQSNHTGGRSIGAVPQSPYPSPPESRQSSQYSYNCSERSHPASWHGDCNGSTKQLYNSFNCDMGLANRRPSNVNKTLRHHGSGMIRTKDYVQNLPHPINSNDFSNVNPLPLPASMRMAPQSPVCGMEINGMEPGVYADQTSPMQVSSDVGCMVEPVKETQPLCHLEPTQIPPPSYESTIQYKTLQHVSMDHSHHGNMMLGEMANIMYPSTSCYDNGARF